jgi:hypothetical protein
MLRHRNEGSTVRPLHLSRFHSILGKNPYFSYWIGMIRYQQRWGKLVAGGTIK